MPFHLLVKWEVVSPNHEILDRDSGNLYIQYIRYFLQIVDTGIGNFNMKLTGRWFPQIAERDSGNL